MCICLDDHLTHIIIIKEKRLIYVAFLYSKLQTCRMLIYSFNNKTVLMYTKIRSEFYYFNLHEVF